MTTRTPATIHHEGLREARVLMVLSSISPLFIHRAIRENNLPFYSEDFGSWRYLGSSATALTFMVFLFWHLKLHYMNLVLGSLGSTTHGWKRS
jgi:hypothetical protein